MANKKPKADAENNSKNADAAGTKADTGSTEESSSVGSFIRAQRELANLSLRQLSGMADISNAYLSQIERGLHQPSLRVLKNVGEALSIDPETLMTRAGILRRQSGDKPVSTVEEAVEADAQLSDEEKQALITVYRSYLAAK